MQHNQNELIRTSSDRHAQAQLQRWPSRKVVGVLRQNHLCIEQSRLAMSSVESDPCAGTRRVSRFAVDAAPVERGATACPDAGSVRAFDPSAPGTLAVVVRAAASSNSAAERVRRRAAVRTTSAASGGYGKVRRGRGALDRLQVDACRGRNAGKDRGWVWDRQPNNVKRVAGRRTVLPQDCTHVEESRHRPAPTRSLLSGNAAPCLAPNHEGESP